MQVKIIVLVVVSVVIAVLLASALGSFTRVPDSALAEVATPGASVGAGSSRPSVAGTNYLPIIFLNSATSGGAWLLAGQFDGRGSRLLAELAVCRGGLGESGDEETEFF